MEMPIPGLYAPSPKKLPFDTSLEIRAFLLQRKQGNLLVYSSEITEADDGAIDDLGGISRHYLSHRHEARFGCDRVTRTFDAPLFCHEDERSSVSGTCSVTGTFSQRDRLGDDFEVIPIPGHTPGATAFLWDSGQHRCLFTGDTIYFRDGEWVAAVLDSSDRDAYVESLEMIKNLEFDVLAPWAATEGQPYIATANARDTKRHIETILDRVKHGDDH